MYVPQKCGKLNKAWSGLGEAKVVTGPDGQPRVVYDTPITTVDVLASGTDVYHDSTGAVIGSGTVSDTWIAGIPNVAVMVGGAALGVMFLGMIGGRR